MDQSPTVVTGKIISDGAAIALNLGFVPACLIAINMNATGTEDRMLIWFNGMTAGHALKALVAGDTADTTDGITSLDSRTINTGSAVSVDGEQGVTIDADFSDDNDVIFYIAFRGHVIDLTLS